MPRASSTSAAWCASRATSTSRRAASRSPGQYAVAEVTMNRRASRRYPNTVCEVVYQKNWDSTRGRYVGAFSWTEFDVLPEPTGEDWHRALVIAEAVYYQRYTPTLNGAMYFHATHIKPDWAVQKRRVAKIGRHIFYR